MPCNPSRTTDSHAEVQPWPHRRPAPLGNIKPIRFFGNSLDKPCAFPLSDTREAGYQIDRVENGLEPYEAHRVSFDGKDQFSPEFLSLNSNNKIDPAILDPGGPGSQPFVQFASGAIQIYLADKTGQLLLRAPPRATTRCNG